MNQLSTTTPPGAGAPRAAPATDILPLDFIEVPANWRAIDPERVRELADSMDRQGLLQPIGVWYRGGGPKGHRLVFGAHRVLAARALGWREIDARVLPLADEAEAQAATDAENLFRNPLLAAEQALAVVRWRDRYYAENPEARRDGGRPRDADRPAPPARRPAPARFDRHAAAATGQDESTIRHKTSLADRLGEEALLILQGRSLTQRELVRLARIKDDEERRKAVTLVAAGMPLAEAIAAAGLPDDAAAEDVAPEPGYQPPAKDEDLSDADWLRRHCGDLLEDLVYSDAFRRDALLYRRLTPARAHFANAARGPLAQGKVVAAGPFHRLAANLVNVAHPSAWLRCGICQGTGQQGSVGRCGICNGHAFALTYNRGKGR